MPVRIQRKRTKGWRMPEGAMYVGRPSVFGNQYIIGDGDYLHPEWNAATQSPRITPERAVELYRNYLNIRQRYGDPQLNIRPYLTGHDLACWCPLDQPCHADVLLELANDRGDV